MMEINNKNDANSLRDGSNSDFANTGVIRFARPIRYAPPSPTCMHISKICRGFCGWETWPYPVLNKTAARQRV
jgi:hypothetical protein